MRIPFPDGSTNEFKLVSISYDPANNVGEASVIKDAGDDPDVTNKALITASAKFSKDAGGMKVIIKGGVGVGTVTRPGLAIGVGEPAINPVPRIMITKAVMEAVDEAGYNGKTSIEITISVPAGAELALRTLNGRLGIVGGISILGTTGIVKPLSSEAWTATISATMDVARAAGLETVVISTGRTSEKAHMKKFNLPEESYVMMGDYLEYSIKEAYAHGFKRIELSAQWAKLLKIAMCTPQTHVRHGALDVSKAVEFLNQIGLPVPSERFNTAREIFDYIQKEFKNPIGAIFKVGESARRYTEAVSEGVPVMIRLISYEGDVVELNG